MSENNRTGSCTVAIVGGGFCGTLVPNYLLRAEARQSLRVVLIERAAARCARGVAYGTRNAVHLLNVPAGRMSALAHDPNHFLDWAHRKGLVVESGDFVPRMVYGEYLNDLLEDAEAAAPKWKRLERVIDQATSIEILKNGSASVGMRSGVNLLADKVVLASGNY